MEVSHVMLCRKIRHIWRKISHIGDFPIFRPCVYVIGEILYDSCVHLILTVKDTWKYVSCVLAVDTITDCPLWYKILFICMLRLNIHIEYWNKWHYYIYYIFCKFKTFSYLMSLNFMRSCNCSVIDVSNRLSET